MDTLKKIGLVMGIVAGVATIIVAVVAVVTLMMNVATKDDISDLKEQMTTGSSRLAKRYPVYARSRFKNLDHETDVRTNAQNHVNHLAKHADE